MAGAVWDATNEEKEALLAEVVEALGFAPTEWRVNFFKGWHPYEGTRARFNPLATTRVINKGETNFNSHGVKNYSNRHDGVQATVETLKLSYYTEVRRTLSQQKITDRRLLANQIFNIEDPDASYWGTEHFADAIRVGWTPVGDKGIQRQASESAVGTYEKVSNGRTGRTAKKGAVNLAETGAGISVIAAGEAIVQGEGGVAFSAWRELQEFGNTEVLLIASAALIVWFAVPTIRRTIRDRIRGFTN